MTAPVHTSPQACTTAALHDAPILSGSQQSKIFTMGRPPWYSQDGRVKQAFLIGVAGGSASGKTSVTRRIIESLGIPWVVLMSMDSFYKDIGPTDLERADRSDYNFDHPAAFDLVGLVNTLRTLKQGKKVSVPIYDFSSHKRLPTTETVYGADVIVFEGVLAFSNKELVDLMDLRIFVDTDDDVRLVRRLRRDIAERGRELNGVIAQYTKFVKPSFDEFVRPSMRYADLIIPRGVENVVAIDLITQTICGRLEERGFMRPESPLSVHLPSEIPKNMMVLEDSPYFSELCNNPSTTRSQFIAESLPVIRRVVNHAIKILDYPTKDVRAVSIVRGGVNLIEQALQEAAPTMNLGELLIHTSASTGEPELHLLRLQHDISKYKVVLLDPVIVTGDAAMMAIRVLLDHEVLEENIFFLSLLVSPQGVHAIASVFPKVHILAAVLDNNVGSNQPELRGRFFDAD